MTFFLIQKLYNLFVTNDRELCFQRSMGLEKSELLPNNKMHDKIMMVESSQLLFTQIDLHFHLLGPSKFYKHINLSIISDM